MWFQTRDLPVEDGWEQPVVPDMEGGLAFGHFIERLIRPAEILWWPHARTRPENGRFGVKLEGSGKVRVFAIGNPILQALIRPFHDFIMNVLRLLPTDGTYHQTAPLTRLKGLKDLYSFDLKAATDSLPAVISQGLLAGLFGDDLPQSWYDIMSNTAFRVGGRNELYRKRSHLYRLTKGKPLGFDSSWPVFSLTHHALVWLAAWRAIPGRRFYDYAVLGDDLVIGHSGVAQEYLKIMSDIEVTISKEKSLISHSGALEFAKRYITDAGMRDLSPVSFRE